MSFYVSVLRSCVFSFYWKLVVFDYVIELIKFESNLVLILLGFIWDRQWVVVNSKGRACTQRVDPKLCLVEVELPEGAVSVGWIPNKTSYLGK